MGKWEGMAPLEVGRWDCSIICRRGGLCGKVGRNGATGNWSTICCKGGLCKKAERKGVTGPPGLQYYTPVQKKIVKNMRIANANANANANAPP